MGIKHIGVEVKIKKRTLWVGDKVYPLAHVTRVEPLEIVPRRGRILAVYGRQAGAWLGLGLLGLLVLACAGNTLPLSVYTVYELVVLAALVVLTTQMIRRLTGATLYVLSIATSGSAHEVVASWDRDRIQRLLDKVVAAIDDPAVDYTVHIDHIDVTGDAVFGDKSGDVIHRDKHVH
ncbi:DUF6232 family protein [Nucisporomicrobium flavum]|jgi:hypothetical protein|uniref:DUF6232 family protein n=1 Tax=Nucisporomicrobium flavum TaxID=2785915 RepID=UPI0018F53ADC|nr:DUF6232 family protein [Nucisporomicrobium flavum]